jgi:hypothetical protein
LDFWFISNCCNSSWHIYSRESRKTSAVALLMEYTYII